MTAPETEITCCANHAPAHYAGVLSCNRPATHYYTPRTGVHIPICAEAANDLPRQDLVSFDALRYEANR